MRGLIVVVAVILSGCASMRPPHEYYVLDNSNPKAAQQESMKCRFEADKSVAGTLANSDAYQPWRTAMIQKNARAQATNLYRECLLSKGFRRVDKAEYDAFDSSKKGQ